MLLSAARSRHSVGLRCGPLCGAPAAAHPVSRSANAACVDQFLGRFSIARLHASDWRNASGAISPVARVTSAFIVPQFSHQKWRAIQREGSQTSAPRMIIVLLKTIEAPRDAGPMLSAGDAYQTLTGRPVRFLAGFTLVKLGRLPATSSATASAVAAERVQPKCPCPVL